MFQESQEPRFELVLVNRDATGKPTGGKKSFTADKAFNLSQFYVRHTGNKKRKPKNKKTDAAAVKIVKASDGLNAYIDTTEREITSEVKGK